MMPYKDKYLVMFYDGFEHSFYANNIRDLLDVIDDEEVTNPAEDDEGLIYDSSCIKDITFIGVYNVLTGKRISEE